MTIRIFLLDDHEIVRRGLRELLETVKDFEVVGESGSAVEASRRIPALRPDVAIFDARLPDGSGIDVCREVRSQDPSIAGLIPCDRRVLGSHLATYVDPRAVRQPGVEDRHVWAQRGDAPGCLDSGAGLTDHLEV